jgi:AcrR family transcriptional regulator
MTDASTIALHGRVGSGLRQVRLSRGMSMRELARRLQVSPATMSNIESGRTRITLQRLTQIADLLDADVEALLGAGGAPAEPALHSVVEPGPRRASAVRSAMVEGAAGNWRAYRPLHLDPPLHAALSAFLEFGYHGATMREIAQRAGLSVPGVYHYYASKQDMLVAILDVTMQDLFSRTEAARAEGDGAVERFCLLVECLALYHTHRRELGFVGASEMRSLVPHQRARVARARRAQQRMVDEEVEQACAEGSFAVVRPREASRAVVTMCTALPQWFDGNGPQSAEQIAAQYVEFALDVMRFVPRRPSKRRGGRPAERLFTQVDRSLDG